MFKQLKRFTRNYSSRNTNDIFDRRLKRLQRQSGLNHPDFKDVQYLKNESMKKIVSTLSFINRDFKNVLNIGSSYGHLETMLCNSSDSAAAINGDDDLDEISKKELSLVRKKMSNIYSLDSSEELLNHKTHSCDGIKFHKVHCNEETLDHPLLAPEKFNCIISNLYMHWINDLPNFLVKANSLLQDKDSVFIGSMFAEDTLFELRSSLQLAEQERKGGLSPHISPYITVQDLGNLLTRAGFKMITINIEEITVDFPDLLTLLDELKLMGENNCLYERESLSKDTLLAADLIYKKLYGIEDEGRFIYPATFRILFFIGWKDSTITSAKRGSQDVDLKDILKQ